MNDSSETMPLNEGVRLDVEWIGGFLYGWRLHQSNLVTEDAPTYEAGMANAAPLHEWIDGLNIDFRDPLYRQFSWFLMNRVQDGYGHDNGLLAETFIDAVTEVLICRGQLARLKPGYQEGIVNLTMEGIPAVQIPARLLLLSDPGRPRDESYMCAQFYCEEPPAPGEAHGQQVLVTKLSHVVGAEEHALFFRRAAHREGDPTVADPAAHVTQLIDREGLSRLRFEACITTMSVGAGEQMPPDDLEYAVL